MRKYLISGMLLVIAGCTTPGVPMTIPTELPTPRAATVTQSIAPTATFTATPGQTLEPVETPTPDPFAGLIIEDLRARTYGEGELSIHEEMGRNDFYTRYLISYPSDGVQVYGFMDVPAGEGSFPVVITVHGYVEPSIYNTLTYTTHYADALATTGILTIHPNLRGYPPSGDGPNEFRVGMAIDVLNLLALVRKLGGQDGPLAAADPERLGLWGHSMGGGISIRAMTVDPNVRAVVLYGSMSGDERRNYEQIYNVFSNQTRGFEELQTAPEDLARLSSANYLGGIQAAVSIHHGELDDQVPPEWSTELCQQLTNLGKTVECFSYPGQPHTFFGDGDQVFIQRTVDFYNRYLR